MTLPATDAAVPAPKSDPWYKFPIVWMVLGGPFLVVLAALSTTYIAYTHVDPVLETHSQPGDTEPKELPALQGRNRAAENAVAPAER